MSELFKRQPGTSAPTTAESRSLSWCWSEQTATDLEVQVMLREVREAACSPERLLEALVGGVDDDRG